MLIYFVTILQKKRYFTFLLTLKGPTLLPERVKKLVNNKFP